VNQFIENNLLDGKRLIIQQAFPRLTIDENNFDIRVYAVKSSSKWTITEKIARITPDGYSSTDEVKGIFPLSSVLPASQKYRFTAMGNRPTRDTYCETTGESLP
jgi:hypothetical protein